MKTLFLTLMLVFSVTGQARDIEPYRMPGQGVHIYDRNTGDYLGHTGSKYELDSIYNKNGRYGSRISPHSLNNPQSIYRIRERLMRPSTDTYDYDYDYNY